MMKPIRVVWLLGTLVALLAAVSAVVLYPLLREFWYLKQLDVTDDFGWRKAAEHLVAMGSVRAIPQLLEWVGTDDGLRYELRGPRSLIDGPAEADYARGFLQTIIEKRPVESVRMLVSLLRDENLEVRKGAAMWLRGAGHLALPYIAEIRSALEDADGCMRVYAALVLWELGEPTSRLEPVLRRELGGGDCWYDALRLLERLPDRVEDEVSPFSNTTVVTSTLPELLRDLQHDSALDALERGLVVGFIAGMGADAKEALPALLGLFSDPDAAVRLRAIEAVGRVAQACLAAGAATAESGKGDGTTYVPAAAENRGQSKTRLDVVSALCAILHGGEDNKARAAAAVSLGTTGLGTDLVVQRLLEASGDEDPELRASCIKGLYLLGKRKPEVVSRFREASGGGSSREKAWALVALFDWGEESLEGFRELIAPCIQDDPHGTAAAVVILGSRISGVAPEFINAALDARTSRYVGYPWSPSFSRPPGEEIVRALRAMGATRNDLLPVVGILRQSYPVVSDTRWHNALSILCEIGPSVETVVGDIERLLDSQDARTRSAAARCLEAIGSPAADGAVPKLMSIYHTDERRVRYDAWRALRVLVGREFVRTEG